MIRFDNVTKRFDDGTEALKCVSVTIPAHKLTAIIGPSGCGKTTLMRMINRLEIPTEGAVYIDELPISERDGVELRRSIGYVIQRIGLIPHMTIEDNVALVPELLGWDKMKIEARVDELLGLVDLDPSVFKKRYPFELSGGQQQRVGVSRALASNPKIILMDEPFSALDPISREQLQKELKKLQRKIRKTIVFVTHDMDEALAIADQIIIMREGQIEQMSSPAELVENQATDFVREFIGQERIDRQRNFGQRSIKEFTRFYDDTWSGETRKVASTLTVDDAIAVLDAYPTSRLAVTEAEEVIGYIGHHSLLQAAMENGKWVQS
ncbi:ABC transporter ATP-binding protein [Sporosarcina sp. JAI121]|uniref:ABC transporter ATP-binding protein n=1 Tax=Sporosarcina sp. JAI121 TaxID=2723064 RepID=UPI0015CAA40E|nr:ATP-binding cassette domain-containing protein [Sporosarcina sp. JAI121]NYF25898.1 osmoprotectant transport system ATP-binding protein [Sporosarcina sp. JAI121]